MSAAHRKKLQEESDTTPLKTGQNSGNAKKPGDARHDKSQQAQNRKGLGVGEDHKTKEMKKRNRGTFP